MYPPPDTYVDTDALHPGLVRAACRECTWIGPQRDAHDRREVVLVKLDRDEHRCWQ